MKIGFFDSGIGGITVLHEALRLLPNEDYIYYADSLNAPYGIKPKDEIKKYIFDAVDFLISQEVKAIVIACNTATSVAIEDLRATYDIPILGMEPAVKPAVEKNANLEKRVLVTATPLTIKEEKLKNLIDKVDNDGIVDLLPLPMLVEFAEHFEFNEDIVLPYLRDQLSSFNLENYGTLVLGCTHFPLYKDMFRKILPKNIDIIDGAIGTVRNLKRILENSNILGDGSGEITFFNSGELVKDSLQLSKYKELLNRLNIINS